MVGSKNWHQKCFNCKYFFLACDPAGHGFRYWSKNPQEAANFVQCVHTSNTYGTSVYDCHQNWRLGLCGNRQLGARPFPYGSHGLCPYIFLSSFKMDFHPNNMYNCSSPRMAQDFPNDLKMGPREDRTEYERLNWF